MDENVEGVEAKKNADIGQNTYGVSWKRMQTQSARKSNLFALQDEKVLGSRFYIFFHSEREMGEV